MMIKDMDSSESGSHHCTRENISETIDHLEKIGRGDEPVDLQDWVSDSLVMALQFKWLIDHLDN